MDPRSRHVKIQEIREGIKNVRKEIQFLSQSDTETARIAISHLQEDLHEAEKQLRRLERE